MRFVLTSSRCLGRFGRDAAPSRELASFDKSVVFVSFFLGNRLAGGQEGVDPLRKEPQAASVVLLAQALDYAVEMHSALG
jgi:hypothetical protein